MTQIEQIFTDKNFKISVNQPNQRNVSAIWRICVLFFRHLRSILLNFNCVNQSNLRHLRSIFSSSAFYSLKF